MEDMSSSAASGSPVAGFLTPRSKVAKMLADIDDAPTPSPSAEKALDSHGNDFRTARASETASSQPDNDTTALPVTYESESGDSDEDVRRPQGRAARRMLVAGKQSSTKSSSPVQRATLADDDEDLYLATPMQKRKQGSKAVSSSPARSQNGNGLFVSPAKSANNDSDDELPSNPLGSKERLAGLIAQKRAERLAREAESERRKKDARAAQHSSDLPDEAFETAQEPVDPNIEKIMSDASRPARKASKKALLEMERETQRLARQQALAHQMKVKKKFTTSDLFAKFKFSKPGAAPATTPGQPLEEDTTASSAPNSDGIEERPKDPVSTPPSSPPPSSRPTPLDRQKELVDAGALSKLVPVRQDSLSSLVDVNEDEELPEMADILQSSQLPKTATDPMTEIIEGDRKGFKLARLGKKAALPRYDSSDDELEIIQALPVHLRAFDRAIGSSRAGRPADSRAIHNLKHLSHLHANDGPVNKKGTRPSVNPKVLENQLRKRAKDQARALQLERIEELRAKGIEVQTTEEREKEAEAFENLLEKARQDAVELRKAEKAALKEAGDEGAMQASDDEDEDEDYVGSGSEDENVEVEAEASADEDEEEEGEGEQDEGNEMVDEAAEEIDAEEEDGNGDEDGTVGDELNPEVDEDIRSLQNEPMNSMAESRKPRKSRIIRDEEDESGPEQEADTSVEPEMEESDPFAAFNFGVAGSINALMSPTQAFNATMQTPTQATQDGDSFDILRRFAPPSSSALPPSLPELNTQVDDDTQVSLVAGSQVPESQRIDLNWETQPPETPVPAGLQRDVSGLNETPGWEPTQDEGLRSPWTIGPKLRRESTLDSLADHETQSTVQMRVSESPAPSQSAPRRGRLVRRQAAQLEDSDDDDDDDNVFAPQASLKPKDKDAFREMARRRREALTAAERADVEKEMREMMEEQAEESEDEYAGLGGDDYVAPETEQDREMIDSSHVDVDERALAAHFAERQRQQDEAETSKLYKDLTTGVLRRKMGANAFDLDEDEDELAVRRRQMRQREEAKKRKALLKDENIATLAEGRQSRGKDAFLKAIADDEGDEETLNLSDEEIESVPQTQDESQQSQINTQPQEAAPLQETSGNKRRLAEEAPIDERPPAKQRRTEASAFRRPTSLMDVKESVSFLLDESNAGAAFGPTALELSSDSEGEEYGSGPDDGLEEADDEEVAAEEARQNHGGYAPNPISMEAKAMPPPRLPACQRRTAPKSAVVDRLSLKRASSTSDSALGRTAWAAGPTTGGFKIPSLLRRATTNTTVNDRGVSTSTTPTLSRENSGVKMGGSKKSSLAYQARADERKAIVEASAKRREENTRRIALLRRNSSALSRGLTGRFE